jgi:hypothetical protein
MANPFRIPMAFFLLNSVQATSIHPRVTKVVEFVHRNNATSSSKKNSLSYDISKNVNRN